MNTLAPACPTGRVPTRTGTEPATLLDPDFEYVNHAKTDVQATWRRFGWTPPDRQRQLQMRDKLNRMN